MTMRRLVLLALTALAVLMPTAAARASSYHAFSLAEAQARTRRGGPPGADVTTLAGLNVITGAVYDQASGDLILVGQRLPNLPGATLDDLVVAVRAVARNTAPLVSIDPTPDTPRTRRLVVRFAGGIENTQYGADMLAADVVLKRVSLGLEPARVPRVTTYPALAASHRAAQLADDGLRLGTQFWFKSSGVALVEREGVFAIRSLRIVLDTRLLNRQVHDTSVTHANGASDESGEAFTASVNEAIEELFAHHPALARLRVLFSLVAVARGLEGLPEGSRLRSWLHDNPVTRVPTAESHELRSVRERYRDRMGRESFVEVSGGIELKAAVLRLQAGDVTALRTLVLRSRPHAGALTWAVPIEDWQTPWASSFASGATRTADVSASAATPPGFSLGVRSGLVLPSVTPGAATPVPPPLGDLVPRTLPPAVLPQINKLPTLPWQGAGKIGGVLLANAARVDGLDREGQLSASIDEGTGAVHLMASGQRATVKDVDLRMFITALWAVYFGREDPGISIDPISPDADRQLVRFIGNIVGSALGRNLLDADYYMKEAAIGAKRPPLPGFRSVDELIGRHSVRHLAVGRRFWFVPEDMKFRRAGNAVIFDGGRIALKTEKLLRDVRGETDEADRAFAKFWTEHYWEIAAHQPVFADLFEWAKLTALARYLKESQVSLQWFLLAHRHLVQTADIPGSVPALRSRSNVLRGVQWVGGVNLSIGMSPGEPGRYVIDEAAAAALRQAQAGRRLPTAPSEGRAPIAADIPVTAGLGDAAYTIVPARSVGGAASGSPVTFHTDLALRRAGEPGIELIRYNAPGRRPGAFGAGWDLYVPYRIAPAGSETAKLREVEVRRPDDSTTKLDLVVPRRMLVVDVVHGRRETLVFDQTRHGVAAWVPSTDAPSLVEGMAYLSDGSFLLFEKNGARFRFDRYGRLTDTLFSATHGVQFTYDGPRVTRLEDTFGGKVDLAYDDAGRIIRAAGPTGATTYAYLDDELVRVRRPSGETLSLIHRRDGRLDEVVLGK